MDVVGVSVETDAALAAAPARNIPEQCPPSSVAPGMDQSMGLCAGRARWTSPSFDKTTCRFDAAQFAKLLDLTGKQVMLDGCADSAAVAVSTEFCNAQEFLLKDCAGQHVWLDLPADMEHKVLQHYLACKEKAPATTSAVLVVPKHVKVASLLSGMKLLRTYNRGTRLYTAVSGCAPQPGIPHTVQIWYDPPVVISAGQLLAAVGTGTDTVTVTSAETNSMQFLGELSGAKARFHVDTGATHSFISADYVRKIGLSATPAARRVALADGQTVQVRGICRARVHIGNIRDVHTFWVLQLDSTYDVLLGQDWLQRMSAVLDFGRRSLTVAVSGTSHTLEASSGDEEKLQDPRISALQLRKAARKRGTMMFLVIIRPLEQPDARCASAAVSLEASDDALIPKQRLQRILDKYKAVFQDLPGGVIRRPGLPEMTIDFEDGKQPPPGHQYRLSKPERDELIRQLTLALEKEWIEPSSAPFGAAVLFAKKKGGGLRMCIDYRAANNITIKNRYPLPRIDDLLDQLNGASCFSGLDLAAGYWQIGIREQDRYKTSFRTPQGLYQWKVMPFGLTNAPAVFASTMQQVFRDMIGKFVLVYLDDILVYSKSPEEHEKHLALVLERLQQHKFYAQLHKCHFALPEVEFLGHMVSKDGIRVDPRKVKIVQDWPVPGTVSQLRSFLGLANYFRRFIDKFSETARPLHALTGKDVTWRWSLTCQLAFEELKRKLTEAPVLRAPDFNLPFEVIADASDFTLGAVLLQEGRPVAYESRKLTPAEINYVTGEKELLAVVHALTVWRCYLDGSRFTIHSDHEPLSYLKSKSSLLPRQVRWSQFLERFDYDWRYKPGSQNVADSLSRVPHADEHGSGTGSITGKHSASETVLDLLGAVSTRSRNTPLERRDRVTPVSEQVPLEMYEALVAAYKAMDNKSLTGLVQRHSLRQSDNGLWCFHQHVWVPTAGLQKRCIQEHHDTPYSGHKGVTKTLAALQRLYWWPGMRAMVTSYVTTCASCQRNKVQGKKPIGLLQPLEVPAEPWAEVSMDFITGLPCTQAGYDSILVFCDRLTKMVHFVPCMKTTDAVGTAKLFLDRVFAAHGLPSSIISDRDTRFTSDFWSALVRMLGVKHKMSTAFHPQTDGQTERVNRVLEEYLRHYVNPHHDDWDEWLPLAEFAYNNSVHEATGHSPFFLNHGMHPRLPGAVRTQAAPVPSNAEAFAKVMADILSSAKARLEQARQRAARCANPRRRGALFKVGDKVLLSSRNIALKTPGSNKLLPKYLGPFAVTQVLSPVTYRLELPSTMKCHNVFHAGLLLEYRSDGREQPDPPPLEFDDGEGGEWYEVDRVLSHRQVRIGSRMVTQYLVKWAGYGDEWNEWRDEAGVTEIATKEYWARVGDQSERGQQQTTRRAQRSSAQQRRPQIRRRSRSGTRTPQRKRRKSG